MKNENTTHPSGPQTSLQSGSQYWMSLEQYNGDAEFAKRAENEFLSSPYAASDSSDGFARRDFLKLMGASLALATTACVRRPVQHIIPYAKAPKEVTPGVPNFYASSWFDGVEGYGTLVKTLEGRPIKMEGNPSHPMNLGALSARGHAEVLSLYDPDRLKSPVRNLQNKTRTNRESVSTKWDDADAKILEELAKGGVAVLTSTLPSPSTRALLGDFTKAFGARWVQYDTMPADALKEAARRSYGKAVVPRYRIDQAKMVITVDADPLGTYLSPAEFTKQWAKFRKPGSEMGRWVSFESMMTVTGMNADDRFRIKPSQQIDVVLGLVNEVVKASKGAANVPMAAQAVLKMFSDVPARVGLQPEMFAKLGEQLWTNKGKSLVMAGGLSTQTEEAVELQIAVNLLNSVLGNDGVTIDHDVQPFETRQGSSEELATLISDMSAGKVKTLIVHNFNPAYQLPTDAGFVEALGKVDFVVYTGSRNDETGKLANYVLPSGSSLENWGDFEFQSGVFSIVQPTIRPLHDSRQFEDSLLAWTKKAKSAPARVTAAADFYEFVRGIWKTEIQSRVAEGAGQSFDEFWYAVLQKGVVSVGAERRDRSGSPRAFNGSALNLSERKAKSGYELVLFSTAQIADGRYANIAWMQELPDPVTKIVWDNYLSVAPATARKEGLKDGDMVELTVGNKKIQVPVHIQPGVHADVLALAIGYGRTDAGKVGSGIGVNAFALASFNKGQQVFSGLSASLKKTGERYRLVSTQDHHVLTGDVAERQLVAETSNSAYMKDAGSGIHRHKIFSIWPDHQYTKHKWAMAVDLNSCTGCSACVVACQSENNIPVVGKKYVMDGREMHWIRIDRYYKGTPDEPTTVVQPMMCQHCETAPCETVCPVLATVHNDEGLNDMVYNRCVGTRYCSNNCPYKVRRFNWFNFSKREAPLHMALNPDVTVRVRGVMEKCTFCVHRIREVTKAGKSARDGSKLVDGTLKTACQQTCPADAIVFGDLNDKDSAVAKLFQDGRTYAVLEELHTVPRVRYMSRVRNTDRQIGHGHKAASPAHGSDNHNQHQGEHA